MHFQIFLKNSHIMVPIRPRIKNSFHKLLFAKKCMTIKCTFIFAFVIEISEVKENVKYFSS
jgi:hypothetical protein